MCQETSIVISELSQSKLTYRYIQIQVEDGRGIVRRKVYESTKMESRKIHQKQVLTASVHDS